MLNFSFLLYNYFFLRNIYKLNGYLMIIFIVPLLLVTAVSCKMAILVAAEALGVGSVLVALICTVAILPIVSPLLSLAIWLLVMVISIVAPVLVEIASILVVLSSGLEVVVSSISVVIAKVPLVSLSPIWSAVLGFFS